MGTIHPRYLPEEIHIVEAISTATAADIQLWCSVSLLFSVASGGETMTPSILEQLLTSHPDQA